MVLAIAKRPFTRLKAYVPQSQSCWWLAPHERLVFYCSRVAYSCQVLHLLYSVFKTR